MGITPDIPFRNYEEIRKYASGFLAKYHPSGAIPVPIEEIIEFQLKLDIIPLPGLRNITDMEGADAFTYGDQSGIVVDEFIYKEVPTRYRFTLAHEIGHRTLHQQYFNPQVDSIDSWKEYANDLSGYQHSIMEYQADDFAGLVLVPKENLKETVVQTINKIKEEGVLTTDNIKDVDLLWKFILERVARLFEVSLPVIEIRMKKDKIRQFYDLKTILKK